MKFRINRFIFKLLSAAVITIALSGSVFGQDEEGITAPTTSEKLQTTVTALASSEMMGRLAGTPENLKAADYIANAYKSLGLKPVNGTYKQEFPYSAGVKPGDNNEVSFTMLIERPGLPKDMWMKLPRKWEYNKDWRPMACSKSGKVSGDLVFAGFGITDPDLNYDDYANIDAKGKIVVILDNAPFDKVKTKKKYEVKTYEDFGKYARLPHKIENAEKHGAIGMILFKVKGDSSDVLDPIAVQPQVHNSGMVIIQAKRTSTSELFPRTKPLATLEAKMNSDRVPQSFPMDNATAVMNVDLKDNLVNIPNVMAMVKGTSKPDEYILVTSHLDHIGTELESGRFTYSKKTLVIYNGADDDASGCAASIELASKIVDNPLEKSVIFVSFNAEEKGLLGSKYFIENPPVPLDKIKDVINLDMIGRMGENLNVAGAGSIPGSADLLNTQPEGDSIGVVTSSAAPEPECTELFADKGIPAITFFTDKHGDIHTKNDTPDKLHYKDMARIVNYIEGILKKLGNS